MHAFASLDAWDQDKTRTHRSLTWQVDSECAEAMRVRERLQQVEQVKGQVMCAMVLLLSIFCIAHVEREEGGAGGGRNLGGDRQTDTRTC